MTNNVVKYPADGQPLSVWTAERKLSSGLKMRLLREPIPGSVDGGAIVGVQLVTSQGNAIYLSPGELNGMLDTLAITAPELELAFENLIPEL